MQSQTTIAALVLSLLAVQQILKMAILHWPGLQLPVKSYRLIESCEDG